MTGWSTGLTWNPQGLASAGTSLATRGATMRQVASGLEGATTPAWKGRASERAGRRRKQLSTFAGNLAGTLERASGAYGSAAAQLTPIKAAMQSLQSFATGNQMAIQGPGFVVDLMAWVPNPVAQAARRALRVYIQSQVTILCGRLTAMDMQLAAKLKAADVRGELSDTATSVASRASDLAHAGKDWAVDTWDEEVVDRVQAFNAGMGRFGKAAFQRASWWDDVLHGRIPHASEMLAHGAYMGGLAFGAGANLIAGEDLHILDDGVPYTGEVSSGDGKPVTGVADLVRDMAGTYQTLDRNDPSDRPSVKVTVVERPGQPPHYIVAAPGSTTDPTVPHGWLGNNHGADWTGNLRGIAYNDSAVTQSVIDAVDKVAAERGDTTANVLLTGHSQGGIIAGNIAANEDFNSRYNVRGVMSAGSPLGTIPIPPDVQVLNVATEGDVVPQLDLWSQQPNVTEVKLAPHPESMGNAHSITAYHQKMQDIAGGGSQPWVQDTSGIDRWNEQMRDFYTGPGETSQTYSVEIGRETTRSKW